MFNDTQRGPNMAKQAPDALLKKEEVLRRTGISNSGLYLIMAEGRFPRPVRVGPRTVRWVESEVQGFIDACVADRNKVEGGNE
ncbi:AlpA family phage regulatory protein [Ramlibacter ginsenosidimutans]|uniref:AlpA family phage regulatory protein n=1 Tax=Ramlibacter ginsenosidimutans TaxID=502333 RepID=A0A934TWC7_9BURK|nr:AlpA family phage regulatory protein [Ramlibacter ginsenosidimutans]MBK6008678.1 AlpA family phage regulatory protein [Ramlibacter ginsenosidimutans]